jgi:hypothetical protein
MVRRLLAVHLHLAPCTLHHAHPVDPHFPKSRSYNPIWARFQSCESLSMHDGCHDSVSLTTQDKKSFNNFPFSGGQNFKFPFSLHFKIFLAANIARFSKDIAVNVYGQQWAMHPSLGWQRSVEQS